MTNRRIVSQSHLIRSLDRHPAMPDLLRRLPPRAAATLIQRVGVSDATELMTMLPAESLLRAMDEAIWTRERPGAGEQVDADVLLEWLEAWNDIGESFLLERLAVMSDEYLILLLSRVIAVESGVLNPDYGEYFDAFVEESDDDRERFGPFMVNPLESGHRDVVRSTLNALWLEDPPRLLRVLNQLSVTPHDSEAHRGWTTTALDVEFERRSFREAQGYVGSEDARAFLKFASAAAPEDVLAMRSYDPIAGRALRQAFQRGESVVDTSRPAHPMMAATGDDASDEPHAEATHDLVTVSQVDEQVAGLRSLLEAAELIESPDPPLLLTQSGVASEPPLTTLLRRLTGEDAAGFERCMRELAFLANALKVGTGSDARELTDADARDVAIATCNLGVELAGEVGTADLQHEPGLIRYFLFGWRALVELRARIVPAFERALAGVDSLRPWVRNETELAVRDLRAALEAASLVDARDAVILLSIAFDAATCRALVPVLDEIPRYSLLLEGGKRPDAARPIASRRDLERVAAVIAALAAGRAQT